MRKLSGVFLGLFLVFAGVLPAFAQLDGEHFMDRSEAVFLRAGAHVFEDSAFTRNWSVGSSDLTAINVEAGYEYKFCRYFGLELPLGLSRSSAKYEDSLLAYDWSDSSITSWYLAPSGRIYGPVSDSFMLFFGGGPDLWYSSFDTRYFVEGKVAYEGGKNEWNYGAHLLAGLSWFIVREPGSLPGILDTPVSLSLEYKYTWVSMGDMDEEEISAINRDFDKNFPAADCDLGGHMVTLGLKWHW